LGLQFGRYELLERIGVGGMAEVWKARVAGIGGFEKIVVVKKILPAFAQNKTFIEMLLAEARLCAVLHHTNIVQTYENGEFEGQYYIAMEWVPGNDLFKILSRATLVGRRLPAEVCLFVAAEVAKGLSYAHGAKDNHGRPLTIIHRDVSPSNVLVSEAGEVKVMDFGVARASMDGETNDGQSRAGVLKGKLGYMSPEQVTGQPFDHRSDIFSLGIILYESITLKRLFLGRTDLETLVNIRDARIEHKFRKHNYIEEPVRAILRRSLARNPDERYATALEMHDDIINLLFEQKIQATNRTLGAFLTELFDPSLDVVNGDDGAGEGTSDGAGSVAAGAVVAQNAVAIPSVERRRDGTHPTPNVRSSYAPAAASPAKAASVSPDAAQHSLSFSAEEMRRQREVIAQRRANPAPERGGANTRNLPAIDTQVELSGVPARRVSRAPVDGGLVDASQSRASGLRPAVALAMPGHRISSGERAAVGSPTLGASPLRQGDSLRGTEEPGPVRPYHLRTGDGHVIGPMSQAAIEGMLRSRTVSPAVAVSRMSQPFQRLDEITALRQVVKSTYGTRGAPIEEGPVSRLNFPNLIFRLYAERATCCLELRHDDAVKSIYIRRGRPQHIAGNQKTEMLGAFLVSQGIISQGDVDLALEHANSTGGRLGDILVGLNLIKPYQLYQVLERQFRSNYVDAFGWEAGTYAIYADENPPVDIVSLDLDPISTLVEGVRTMLPLSILEPYFEPFLDAPYRRTRNPRISVESLRFQAREAKALGLLMSSRTLREVIEERCGSRQQRLAIQHVLFLMLQTELLTFDSPAGA
jgi:eukaryotic-like serine/threonine-protein kinase